MPSPRRGMDNFVFIISTLLDELGQTYDAK